MSDCVFPRSGNSAYKSIKAHGTASAFEPSIIDISRYCNDKNQLLKCISLTFDLPPAADAPPRVYNIGDLPPGCQVVFSAVSGHFSWMPTGAVTFDVGLGNLMTDSVADILLDRPDTDLNNKVVSGLVSFVNPLVVTDNNKYVNVTVTGIVPFNCDCSANTIRVDLTLFCPPSMLLN
jgi:hypothetical protein